MSCRRRPFCGDSSGTCHRPLLLGHRTLQAILSMQREKPFCLLYPRRATAEDCHCPLQKVARRVPWPSKPRRDGGVDAAAQRRPSFPLKIRGNLVSPDRSVALWDFSRRMVRQVGGAPVRRALLHCHDSRPLGRCCSGHCHGALHSAMLLEALNSGGTMGEDCRTVAPFFYIVGSGSLSYRLPTRFLETSEAQPLGNCSDVWYPGCEKGGNKTLMGDARIRLCLFFDLASLLGCIL